MQAKQSKLREMDDYSSVKEKSYCEKRMKKQRPSIRDPGSTERFTESINYGNKEASKTHLAIPYLSKSPSKTFHDKS